MRDQQRILFDTILGARNSTGALKMEAAFLTFADLLDCVRQIAANLGGNPEALNPHTVQGWFKTGIVKEHNTNRTTRNRLYCGIDLIRVASVFYLTHTAHVYVETAGHIADVAVREILERLETCHPSMDPNADLNPADFIVAVTNEGQWKIFRPDDRKSLDMSMRIAGLSVLFNFVLLIAYAIPVLQEKWKEKAEWLKGLIERALSKKTAKGGK